MHFYVFGINHHIADISVREKVHFSETQIIEASEKLENLGYDESVILSTCNRSEIYIVTEKNVSKSGAVSFYEEFFVIKNIESCVFLKEDMDALTHIISVSCGLDSVTVGEDQILGQVKEAWQMAMNIGSTKKTINQIFREAITFAKKIKTCSDISLQPISTAYIGIKKISSQIDLSKSKCLVIGVGQMGQLALKYLKEEGAYIYISNRREKNSLKVKAEYPDVKIIDFTKIAKIISDVDVIISATSSPHTIVKKEFFDGITSPKIVLDMSLPRDVDPDVSLLDNVTLYDVDTLKYVSDQNVEKRKDILNSYKKDIDSLAKELIQWMQNANIDVILGSLDERCNTIAEETLDYIFRKTDMTHGQKMKVEKIVRKAIKKAAKSPVINLKNKKIDDINKEDALKILKEVYEI